MFLVTVLFVNKNFKKVECLLWHKWPSSSSGTVPTNLKAPGLWQMYFSWVEAKPMYFSQSKSQPIYFCEAIPVFFCKAIYGARVAWIWANFAKHHEWLAVTSLCSLDKTEDTFGFFGVLIRVQWVCCILQMRHKNVCCKTKCKEVNNGLLVIQMKKCNDTMVEPGKAKETLVEGLEVYAAVKRLNTDLDWACVILPLTTVTIHDDCITQMQVLALSLICSHCQLISLRGNTGSGQPNTSWAEGSR